MAEARQIDRVVDQFAADQSAAARQLQLLGGGEVVDRHLVLGLRSVRARRTHAVLSPDQEDEARPEGVRRADQVAEVHGLADALGADREEATHGRIHARL
jgi:hypothetical protein